MSGVVYTVLAVALAVPIYWLLFIDRGGVPALLLRALMRIGKHGTVRTDAPPGVVTIEWSDDNAKTPRLTLTTPHRQHAALAVGVTDIPLSLIDRASVRIAAWYARKRQFHVDRSYVRPRLDALYTD